MRFRPENLDLLESRRSAPKSETDGPEKIECTPIPQHVGRPDYLRKSIRIGIGAFSPNFQAMKPLRLQDGDSPEHRRPAGGDARPAAEAIGKRLGVEEIHADLLAADKSPSSSG